MAEHTRLHLWLNTIIAVAAMAASGTSGYFAWQSYTLKTEALGFTVNSTNDCRLEFTKMGEDGVLSLCWIVTITNQSDLRVSIVRFQAFDVSEKNVIFRSGFPALEDSEGKTVSAPFSLGPGEPKQFLMRVPFAVPNSVASLAKTLPETATLHHLQSIAIKSDLDILGNKVQVKYFDEGRENVLVTWPDNMRVVTGAIQFFTGRGNKFIAQMTFPPVLHTD
jgi:hypothetical protein